MSSYGNHNEQRMENEAEQDDILLFADEENENTNSRKPAEKWKVIIADDEQEVHRVTRMVLGDFEFDGKGLEFLSAYNAGEAKELINKHPDAALILLDVVMDEEDSGLRVIKYIRDVLKNKSMRIILRTGQPGQAPEKMVIMDYDINDYKEKTELTAQKLFTTMVASLRSYRDIRVIENNKQGLEEIIKSSATIFELQSMKKFASGVLTQLTSILNLNKTAIYCNSLAARKEPDDIYILAATGDYSATDNRKISEVLSSHVLEYIEESFRDRESKFYEDHFVCYFQSKSAMEYVIYFEGSKKLSEWDRYLIEIYSVNVSIAFENINLNEEMENTQKEIIFTMGEIAETRSKETGYHVKRVAEYSKLLALKYGLPEEEAEILRLASPMHDVGKVAIADAILNKPGKLTPEEFEIMKTHAILGYTMLKHSNRRIISAAAIIAHQHHERYNGSGYPHGLKGDRIHIYGRITAIADVFDALCSERVYKRAWDLPQVLDYIASERGEHFDPALVELFFHNLDEIVEIKEMYSDQKIF